MSRHPSDSPIPSAALAVVPTHVLERLEHVVMTEALDALAPEFDDVMDALHDVLDSIEHADARAVILARGRHPRAAPDSVAPATGPRYGVALVRRLASAPGTGRLASATMPRSMPAKIRLCRGYSPYQ